MYTTGMPNFGDCVDCARDSQSWLTGNSANCKDFDGNDMTGNDLVDCMHRTKNGLTCVIESPL